MPLVGYESDGLAYTFRYGLPYPTGEDGSPDHLEDSRADAHHPRRGRPTARQATWITIADGDLAFAAEALYGEDTPEHRDKLRYGKRSDHEHDQGRGRSLLCWHH